ncbi:thioesterase family protein [Lysobacter capsici]|uniref:thioesterase family protein n=1 Tax=Lysobacter capsici TaxID=435897 RepID=UPI001C0070D6|nr:thioesterase family protein [Lysobacter capsici]QWF17064.1 thioesterase family protein [Lysobacter capsici]
MPHPQGQPSPAAYFERVDRNRFRATEQVGGGWNPAEQHIAPAFGLLAHAAEADRDARRDDGLRLARLSYDILGVLPIDVVDIEVAVLRPGRTIELVEARLSHAGRVAVILRAWLMQDYDTAAWAGSTLPRIAPVDTMPAWEPGSLWPGGFVRSVEVRRAQVEPGRAAYWLRTACSLIAGEQVSATARVLGMLDIANGITPRAAAEDVAFPNLDLTAHLFASPRGEWLGLDTCVSFGASGIGLTHSILHDAHGPIGAVSQCLTVRPRSR